MIITPAFKARTLWKPFSMAVTCVQSSLRALKTTARPIQPWAVLIFLSVNGPQSLWSAIISIRLPIAHELPLTCAQTHKHHKTSFMSKFPEAKTEPENALSFWSRHGWPIYIEQRHQHVQLSIYIEFFRHFEQIHLEHKNLIKTTTPHLWTSFFFWYALRHIWSIFGEKAFNLQRVICLGHGAGSTWSRGWPLNFIWLCLSLRENTSVSPSKHALCVQQAERLELLGSKWEKVMEKQSCLTFPLEQSRIRSIFSIIFCCYIMLQLIEPASLIKNPI